MTTATNLPGGTYHLGDLEVTRVGYGAMQLSGPGIFGPPKDRDEAVAVLREVVEMGINHIDTSDYYGPYVTNEIIREALAPYPDDLCIVTKVAGARDDEGNWLQASSPDQLRRAVHDNLERLGLEAMDVVNLRNMPEGRGETPWARAVRDAGRDAAGGADQAPRREHGRRRPGAPGPGDRPGRLRAEPLQRRAPRGRRPRRLAGRAGHRLRAVLPARRLHARCSPTELDQVAADLGATPLAVALAWLLQRSPNILLIPGTSSRAHLRENVAGAGLELPADALARLDAIAG